jgi:hypothetical protein
MVVRGAPVQCHRQVAGQAQTLGAGGNSGWIVGGQNHCRGSLQGTCAKGRDAGKRRKTATSDAKTSMMRPKDFVSRQSVRVSACSWLFFFPETFNNSRFCLNRFGKRVALPQAVSGEFHYYVF